MKEQALRRVIRKLILENIGIDEETMAKLDDLVLHGEIESAIELAHAIGYDNYLDSFLTKDEHLLRQALQSKISGGRIGDTWVSKLWGKGSTSCMYNKRKGKPEINQGIQIEFVCKPDVDPSNWTMTVKNAFINEYEPARDWGYSGKWNKKMPLDHPLASKQPRPCSFEAIVDLFDEFIALCDELNPPTAN